MIEPSSADTAAAPTSPRRPRRKIASRERVLDAPNFRDHGLLVERSLIAVVLSLQRRHGRAYASSGTYRSMIEQDTGHAPGVGTIDAALDRLESQGLLAQWWLGRGQTLPDGVSTTARGTRLVWWPIGRDVRRALQRRSATRDRRAPIRNRTRGSAETEIAALYAAAAGSAHRRARAAETDVDGRAYELKRAWSMRMAAELAQRWAAEDAAAAADPSPPY